MAAWAGLAGQPLPWPNMAVLGVSAAVMLGRRTRPVAAALILSAGYVISVQAGWFYLHGSSPGTTVETIGTGIAVPALCYTLAPTSACPRPWQAWRS